MDLEFLPNEIFLELFEYFNGTDLFRLFYGLNSRFNSLLYNQFRAYRFQFKSISKRHFDMICQQHLPLIADRIVGICLSDNDDTPEEINLFLSYMPSWNQFNRLQSLSLSSIPSFETLMKLLDACHQLRNFTSLKLSDPYFRIGRPDLQSVVSKIWSLPKLIRCDFDINMTLMLFCMPTTISSSLKYVSVKGNSIKWNQINRLFKYTPHLIHLSISIAMSDHDDYLPTVQLALIKLKIVVFFTTDLAKMILLLKNTPNLCRLDVQLRTGLIDGYRWEEIIRNYLPNLKTFRFSMNYFYNDRNLENLIINLVDSYRTPFWIDEHQWFVRCLSWGKTIYLYTLSHTFCDFGDTYSYPDSWRSTCPDDNEQNFCNNITDISCDVFFEQSIPSSLRICNIEHLNIKLPINSKFWSMVPSLDRLHSLTILPSHIDTFQSQLQVLLNRAPNLCRLTIYHDESLSSQVSLFKCTNASIHELRLKQPNHCFNDQQCKTLAHSSLGIQCEELSISVLKCESIVYLVENMINLRSLDVQCNEEMSREHFLRTENDDKSLDENMSKKNKLSKWLKDRFQFVNCTRLPQIENDEESLDENISNIDKLIQWLEDRLPPTSMIIRHPKFFQSILIWM